MHAFGDVPAPVVIGYLKGSLAPNCTPAPADDQSDDLVIPDECESERGGIRDVLLVNTVRRSFLALLGCSWPFSALGRDTRD